MQQEDYRSAHTFLEPAYPPVVATAIVCSAIGAISGFSSPLVMNVFGNPLFTRLPAMIDGGLGVALAITGVLFVTGTKYKLQTVLVAPATVAIGLGLASPHSASLLDFFALFVIPGILMGSTAGASTGHREGTIAGSWAGGVGGLLSAGCFVLIRTAGSNVPPLPADYNGSILEPVLTMGTPQWNVFCSVVSSALIIQSSVAIALSHIKVPIQRADETNETPGNDP